MYYLYYHNFLVKWISPKNAEYLSTTLWFVKGSHLKDINFPSGGSRAGDTSQTSCPRQRQQSTSSPNNSNTNDSNTTNSNNPNNNGNNRHPLLWYPLLPRRGAVEPAVPGPLEIGLKALGKYLEVPHSCHILPFQPILWNKYFPAEPANAAKHSQQLISEGGRIWQVGARTLVSGITVLIDQIPDSSFGQYFDKPDSFGKYLEVPEPRCLESRF